VCVLNKLQLDLLAEGLLQMKGEVASWDCAHSSLLSIRLNKHVLTRAVYRNQLYKIQLLPSFELANVIVMFAKDRQI